MKKNLKIKCEISTSFHSYENEKLDNLAEKQIEQWVKDSLKGWCDYMPLYIEKVDGKKVKDVTSKSKIKVGITKKEREIRVIQLVGREGVLSQILDEYNFTTKNHKAVFELLYNETLKEMEELGLVAEIIKE